MSLQECKNVNYYGQKGIIYQVAQAGSLTHLDIYSGGGNTGSDLC
ncbi:hypothetical protein ACFRAE_13960 [Sphingobacterium sp. HJSM2_6]